MPPLFLLSLLAGPLQAVVCPVMRWESAPPSSGPVSRCFTLLQPRRRAQDARPRIQRWGHHGERAASWPQIRGPCARGASLFPGALTRLAGRHPATERPRRPQSASPVGSCGGSRRPPTPLRIPHPMGGHRPSLLLLLRSKPAAARRRTAACSLPLSRAHVGPLLLIFKSCFDYAMDAPQNSSAALDFIKS